MPTKKKRNRAKKRAKRKGGLPEMPVDSFADIAFLLIVFFIVASTLAQTHGIVTEIPSGQKSDAKSAKTPIVQLRENRVMLNDEPTDLGSLKQKLVGLKLYERGEEGRIVMLEAAGNVDYETYYNAMTSITAAGGIITIVKEDDGK